MKESRSEEWGSGISRAIKVADCNLNEGKKSSRGSFTSPTIAEGFPKYGLAVMTTESGRLNGDEWRQGRKKVVTIGRSVE